MSVAERWEKEWRNFSVLQWADCFKPKEEQKATDFYEKNDFRPQ